VSNDFGAGVPKQEKGCLSCAKDYVCLEISSRRDNELESGWRKPAGHRGIDARVAGERVMMKSERQSQRDNTRGHAHQSGELPIAGAPRMGYEALTKFLESENRRLREARHQLEAAGLRQVRRMMSSIPERRPASSHSRRSE